MIADRIATYKAGGDRKSAPQDQSANLHFDPVTHAQAAQLVNVSERSVKSASIVRNQGVPELARMVEKGEQPARADGRIPAFPCRRRRPNDDRRG